MVRRIYALWALLIFFLCAANGNAAELWWGNYSDQAQSLTGNSQLGTYEAAMFVSGTGDFQGIKISGLRFRSRLYSNATDVKVWVRSALDGSNLAEATVSTPGKSSTEWSQATFDQPVDVPTEGVYVGYSFTLSSWYSDYDYTPVVYAKKVTEKSFYLKQPTETAFTDKSATGCLAAQVSISGESLKNNAASIADDMDDVMAKVGDEVTVTANLKNLGANGVKSIGYTYDMNGTTKEGSVTLDTPIQNIYNGDGTATLSLGKPETEGTQEITIKLTKVNGVANENTSKVKATVNVVALAQSANRKTLVEVYNDKQKPNSPRAFVGMEKLKEALGDSVVILNIHMSDSFAVASYKDRASDSRYYSAPIAEVDRMTLTDPYYGNAKAAPYHFTADKVVSPYLKRISEAELDVKANWTDDKEDSVSITATTKFLMSSSSAYYRLGFAVIKDSITSGQYNYITYYKSSYPDDDMAYWCAQPYSTTAINNNLVVASSDASGIEKSVPRKVVKDEELTYNYGLKVPVVNGQKGVNARIVVFLVNTNTREVVNANVAEIQSAAATGIKQAIAATDNGLTRVYSMGGSLVATGKDLSSLRLQPGLYIVQQGGKTSKMLVK
ncbi:MAG: hypothetical protein PUF32_01275 [Prevotella sp.]|nr:hypothetical protein [Prevotella sp.]